ncbi:MAG: DUF4383 domain-containing protein [Actinomycetota bacterium]|nr:DUF4383 domain-containing protein [Actinomycetota bacterium]
MQKERKGVSLAKGPAAILGAVLVTYGILALILGNNSFRVVNVPNGPITYGETFLGIENNGWTNLLWIAAGGLLLFGAPLHWGAKAASLIVGLVFGAASVISLVTQWADDNWGVFGVFAANNWTTLAWGAIATYLLVTALLPRVGKKKQPVKHKEQPVEPKVVVPPASTVQRERVVRVERVEPAAEAAEERHAEERHAEARRMSYEPGPTKTRVVAPADGDGPEDHVRRSRR